MDVMGQFLIVWLLLIFLLQVIMGEIENSYKSIDPVILQRVSELQQSLLPLPEGFMKDLVSHTAAFYLPVIAKNGKCRKHSKYTLERILQADMWALSMVDASSKLPPGLLDGHLQDLGNYDQCMRVQEPGQQFRGQHCFVKANDMLSFQVDNYFKSKVMYQYYPGGQISFSLCVPSSCNSEDILIHLTHTLVMTKINASTEHFQVYCSTSEPIPFRTKDFITIGIFATILVLVALSSWYDFQTSGSKSEFLSAFSLISNWRALVETKSSAHDIPCLSGLKIICTVWFLFNHRMKTYHQYIPLSNYISHLEYTHKISFAVIGSGYFTIEIFFLISGIVRTYSFLRDRYYGKPLNIINQYIQRYFRMMPTMVILVLFFGTLNIHLTNGPLWRMYMTTFQDTCSKFWWTNFLQINNFIDVQYMCMPESWFIAAEYQLFVFSPLLLIPLYFRPKLGLIFVAAIFTVCNIAKIVAVFTNELHSFDYDYIGPKMDRHISYIQFNTFYRAGSYFTGIVLGYALFENKYGRRKITLSKSIVQLFWLLTVMILVGTHWLSSVILSSKYKDNLWLSALHVGLVERLYIAAIAWVVLACTLGHGGWVNWLLSWPKLRPFAKLSFGIMMVNVIIQLTHILSTYMPINFSIFNIVYLGLGDLLMSYTLAVVLFLTVENPCNRIVNYLLRDHMISNDLTTTSQLDQIKEKEKEN